MHRLRFSPGFLALFVAGLLACLLGCPTQAAAQPELPAYLNGRITDQDGQPVSFASFSLSGPLQLNRRADSLGRFRLQLPPGSYQFVVKQLGYSTLSTTLLLEAGQTVSRTFPLVSQDIQIDSVDIQEEGRSTRLQETAFMDILPIDTREIQKAPNLKGDIEQFIQTLPGVGGSSEFSSQYRVRGGNYDENLVYIDGVEIYRPQLVRQGQQEGLGLTNANLAEEVSFSAGGFQALYGDKMSSVLNITYKDPTEFAGTVELGLISQNLHVEGTLFRDDTQPDPLKTNPEPAPVTYAIGFRRFTTSYLLNSLDTEGEYEPFFYDLQGVVRWRPPVNRPDTILRKRRDGGVDSLRRPDNPLRISLLGIGSSNNYVFRPQNRETTLGSINNALRLFMAFEGQEITRYLTGQGALTVDHRPRYHLKFQHILSVYRSAEDELFTVEGGYRLADVNTNLGSEDFNEVVNIRGVGTELRHARNFLDIRVVSMRSRGEWVMDRKYHTSLEEKDIHNRLYWGINVKHEYIQDTLFEWNATDSAEFVELDELIRAQNELRTTRLSGYLQYQYKPLRNLYFNFGMRASWWSLNEELVWSPRFQAVWEPSLAKKQRKLQLRAAVGLYQQPPFYREIRDLDGTLNPDRPAQRSLHFILGGDYQFRIAGRRFKLFAEAYYKQLSNLVPYEIQNVRLRYYAFENANGYAWGIDTRINGQFIQGIDSWLSLSVMQTKEEVESLEQGLVARPADQRVQVGLFFQDEIPNYPSIKAHVNLVYNSGLPFGPPSELETRTVFRAPNYTRVDLGVSKLITIRGGEGRSKLSLKSLWIALEVFNLFARQNTVGYTWISDVFDTRYAVPNFLSQRLVSARVIAQF